MFSSSSSFRNIPCPKGPQKCLMPNCIFSHAPKAPPPILKNKEPSASPNPIVLQVSESDDGPHNKKRRKLDNRSQQASVPQFGAPFSEILTATNLPGNYSNPSSRRESYGSVPQTGKGCKELASSTRPISPPPLVSRSKMQATPKAASKSKLAGTAVLSKKAEALIPRTLPKDPAPYMSRLSLLQHLHKAMESLNGEAAQSYDESISSLQMSSQDLIVAANDEEEDIARGKASVYTNIIKMRIAAYKRMSVLEWKAARLGAINKQKEAAAEQKAGGRNEKLPGQKSMPGDISKPTDLSIELSTQEQLLMLNRFTLSDQDMRKAQYILTPPSTPEIEEAKRAVESALNYEVCERCTMRFQVFPQGRKEDGALTTNGKCIHHWGKISKGSYSCCNKMPGSAGCTTGATHVFKINGAARLASILQFERTAVNPAAKNDFAVAMDCEMAWTCYGLELIRLSATKWPTGEALIDTLVRPIGNILDLNSRFSGITPRQYLAATRYEPEKNGPHTPALSSQSQNLPIVSSPAAARSLLLSYITTSTVLIGHSFDNDLNVLRLLHPTIVDTSLLFVHPRGLPYRHALRQLVKQFLNRDIQTGGADGHDSLEDSLATGDLVRWKCGLEWKRLKGAGWSVEDGKFFAPPATDKSDAGDNAKEEKVPTSLPPYENWKVQGMVKHNEKRKGGQVHVAY